MFFVKIIFITLFTLSSFKCYTNNLKIGYININELLQLMPEINSVNNQMYDYINNLEQNLAKMQKDFQIKYSDYENNKNLLPESLKYDKEQELQNLSQRINDYQIYSQYDISNKKNDLLKPLYDIIKKIINEIAVKNEFIYILDNSNNIIINAPPENNIINIVANELKIDYKN